MRVGTIYIKLIEHEERNSKMVNINPEDKDEFIQYLLQTVELTKKIFPHISHLRDSGDKEEYSKRFRELLKIEREKLNQ